MRLCGGAAGKRGVVIVSARIVHHAKRLHQRLWPSGAVTSSSEIVSYLILATCCT